MATWTPAVDAGSTLKAGQTRKVGLVLCETAASMSPLCVSDVSPARAADTGIQRRGGV
jgi:hypothetical protein